VALGSVENEGSEDLVDIRFYSLHEQHEQDSFLMDQFTASAACGSDDMPQLWPTFLNQFGTTPSYSPSSASNLAAATAEGADLNEVYNSYSTYTIHNWQR
jgi:hypothetical protein